MKTFACGDVVPGCDARFVCATDDDILAAGAHPNAGRYVGVVRMPRLLHALSTG